ncbi:hypothetical protein SASPL_102180 [Salvia splendens]|uniref:Uncharacterized protein n=1 Tax=Salvia splendens TaxID=180675 RepID=A0A8X8YX10_SALSN|nr:hypothetical protein SASPL_102180 [Salvia splendens]
MILDVEKCARDMKANIEGSNAQMPLDVMRRKKETCGGFTFEFEIDGDEEAGPSAALAHEAEQQRREIGKLQQRGSSGGGVRHGLIVELELRHTMLSLKGGDGARLHFLSGDGMKNYPAAPAYSILDTSFDFSNYTTVTIPTVSFAFSGGVKIDLIPSGILISVCSTVACLAFAGNGDATDTGIFGNTQQLTFEVVYDVAGGKLGFVAVTHYDGDLHHPLRLSPRRHHCHRYRSHRRNSSLVVGLGVLWWVPARAATLQLCVLPNCLIFQLYHAPRRALPLPLRPRRDPGGAVEPQRCGDANALEVGELVDVREPAHELRGCRLGASMGELADEVLGIYGMGKDNAVGRSDWEDEDLTWEQVEYACHDVFLSYLITIIMD